MHLKRFSQLFDGLKSRFRLEKFFPGIRNERHPNKRKKLDTTVHQENVRRKLLVLNGLPPASFAYAAKSSYTYENKS